VQTALSLSSRNLSTDTRSRTPSRISLLWLSYWSLHLFQPCYPCITFLAYHYFICVFHSRLLLACIIQLVPHSNLYTSSRGLSFPSVSMFQLSECVPPSFHDFNARGNDIPTSPVPRGGPLEGFGRRVCHGDASSVQFTFKFPSFPLGVLIIIFRPIRRSN